MNASAVVIMAMLLVAVIPSGAAGVELIPYIEIIHPEDGSTVGTQETLVVVAEGRDFSNPTFSVEMENVSFEGPLKGCVYSVEEGSDITKMYCKQELGLESFKNQKVTVRVSVQENTGTLTDSVGLYVSGHRA